MNVNVKIYFVKLKLASTTKILETENSIFLLRNLLKSFGDFNIFCSLLYDYILPLGH